MSGDGWITVERRRTLRRRFTQAQAEDLEAELDIRGLAAALLSEEIGQLLLCGWEYAGVVPGGKSIPVADPVYEYSSVPVEKNRWSSMIILCRRYGARRESGEPAA